MPHIAALDIGEKRIGVALANSVARLPRPYGVITGGDGSYKKVTELIASEDIEHLVVGLPRGLDGQETDQTRYVRAFVQALQSLTSVPITFQDEAVTSRKAHEELRQTKKSYNKEDVDALAATYILQDYLIDQHEGQQ